MKSREDETYVALANIYCGSMKERELYEIAMSLGRIADMLAEMNRYIVDYDDNEKQRESMADFVDTAEKAAKVEIMSEKDAQVTSDAWRMHNSISEAE